MKLTRQQIHEQVYYFGLVLIVASLPVSIFAVSMGQILILLNWLAEGRFREKWQRLKSNRALLAILSLFLLHALSLLWSTDTAYGAKDMRIKATLFVIPLVVGTSVPLLKKQVDRIMLLFTFGVFVASMASVAALLGWVDAEVDNYRDLSLFISHIRLSLMIVVAILVVVWFLFIQRNHITRWERIWYMAGLLWFPVYMVLLKSLSGIVIMAFLAFFLALRAIFEIRDTAIRFMVLVPVIMIPLFIIIYIGSAVNKYYSFEEIHFNEIDQFTAKGNPYKNYPNLREVENGHYVWLHISDKELEEEWNKRSGIDYYGRTHNGNSLRTTLIRYLTSRGLRKDAAGMSRLSDEEIEAVEHGIANHIYLQRFRLYPRIYELIWEIDRYRLGYSPNEKSVVQRYLYLEAGWNIFRQHPWLGVGTGDVNQAFKRYYERVDSPLDEKSRRRAHNQLLTFMIAFGIPGFLICMFALIAPLFLAGRHRSFFAAGFLILVFLSMLNEDTLETSVGAGFVAIFYSLFVFGPDYPWLKRKLFSFRG